MRAVVAHRTSARALTARRLPWAVPVLAVFLASRVVTTAIMLVYAWLQPANPWTAASPDYAAFANLWDGRWYQLIAASGYPSELPHTADGHVTENAWAFMPVYPMLVRAVMTVTTLPWEIAAVSVSVLFAAAATLVFFALMRTVLGDPRSALFAVAVLCFGPLSPVLQVAYAESMHVFLLSLALLLVVRRRYLVLLPVILVMSFTRPTGLAFALFLVLHVGQRWWMRRQQPFSMRELVASGAAAVFSGLCGLAWPGIVWLVTGSLTGYTDTELAWRAPYIGWQHLVPFAPWIQGANWWLGVPLGVIALLLALVVFVLAMLSPWVRRLGTDIRLWIVSYAVYLLAVFFPQSSTFRLLLPMFPLAGALAVPRSRIWRAAVIAAGIAGQIGWVHIAWWIDGADWTPP